MSIFRLYVYMLAACLCATIIVSAKKKKQLIDINTPDSKDHQHKHKNRSPNRVQERRPRRSGRCCGLGLLGCIFGPRPQD